jgi:hypothetical protein
MFIYFILVISNISFYILILGDESYSLNVSPLTCLIKQINLLQKINPEVYARNSAKERHLDLDGEVCIYTYIYAYIYICMCVYSYFYIYIYLYVCMYIYMYVHVYI